MSLLWTLTFPISVLVRLAFWTLINPLWDLKMPPGFATRLSFNDFRGETQGAWTKNETGHAEQESLQVFHHLSRFHIK